MDQQVTGQLVALEPRQGGWVAVSILEQGKQYPLKLSTKKPELIQQAQSLWNQLVTAAYNEQQSTNINQHTGQPYINRYLEALALGQVDLVGMPTQIQPQQYMPPQPQYAPQPAPMQAPQPMPAPMPVPQVPAQLPQPQPIQPWVDPTEVKIHRQTATKVAVRILHFLPEGDQNLSSLLRIAEQLVTYYDQGVPWVAASVPQPAQAQYAPGPAGREYQPAGYEQENYPQDPGPQGIPLDDDDIPF